ncbi:MAG: tetratricopeptide repeat protein, partial [Planktothrix sp.]
MLVEINLAIAKPAKALKSRNIKSFRRVTEEGYSLGKALQQQGQPDRALDYFQKALNLNPQFPK